MLYCKILWTYYGELDIKININYRGGKMNIKDKLIRKLLDVGKKHRILVYPTLILVAIISAISHAVYWGRGNGKRLVVSVSIVALLITQSLFLTSSALDDSVEPPAASEEQPEYTEPDDTTETVAENIDLSTPDNNTEEITEVNTEEIAAVNTEEITEVNTEENTEVNTEENTDVNTEENTDVNTEENIEENTEDNTSNDITDGDLNDSPSVEDLSDENDENIQDNTTSDDINTDDYEDAEGITTEESFNESTVEEISQDNSDLSDEDKTTASALNDISDEDLTTSTVENNEKDDDKTTASTIDNSDKDVATTSTESTNDKDKTDLANNSSSNRVSSVLSSYAFNRLNVNTPLGVDPDPDPSTDPVDPDSGSPDDPEEPEEPEETSEFGNINYYFTYTIGGTVKSDLVGSSPIAEDGTTTIKTSADLISVWDYNNTGSFSFGDLCFDEGCTQIVSGNDVDEWDESSLDSNGNIIKLYYKVSRTKYNVKITSGDDVKNVELDTSTGDLSETVEMTVQDASDYGLSKYAYDYQGLSYNNVTYSVGQPIDVSMSTGLNMTALWSPEQFTVSCDVNPDGEYVVLTGEGQTIDLTCTYDSGVALPTEAAVSALATSKGYYLKGWIIDGDTTVYDPGVTIDKDIVNSLSITSDEDSNKISASGKGITAVWAYRNIDLVLNDSGSIGTVSVSDDTVTAEYGDYISVELTTKYKDNAATDDNFSYVITSGSSELAALGLNVSETKTGDRVTGFKISGYLSNVHDGVTVNININDTNKKTGETTDTNRQITFVSNKKKVTMIPSTVKDSTNKAISKTYDGDDAISTSGRCDVEDVIGSDVVYATFDSAATLSDPNAGEGKAVTLTNVNLAGTDSGKYLLINDGLEVPSNGTVDLAGVATVTKSIVPINIRLLDETASDTVLFGEARPEYTLEVTDVSKLSSADRNSYNNATTDSARMNFIINTLGFSNEWTCGRTSIYSPASTYTIEPKFGNATNYTLSGIPSASFTVARDAGDGHYELNGTPVNGIYPGLTISAKEGYDKIRVVSDGDISASMSKSAAEALFSNYVTIPNGKNQTIKIQMLKSSTGAITDIVTLENISVDWDGPELVSYTVSPNKSYFNEFGFGAYYHAQVIDGVKIESVDINFIYSSDGSECDTLHYTFTDYSGNVISTGTAAMKKDNATNNYSASITIGTGIYGKLAVYATNIAGNQSMVSYIKLNEEFMSSEYYEWMVENSITGSDIVVTDSEGNPAVSNIWYNSLSYKTSATDSDSGLQYIDWTITDPNGSTTTSTENAGANLAGVSSQTDYNKITGYTFSGVLNSENIPSGNYTIAATLYDNAGNSIELNSVGPYLLDCKKPVIDDITDYPASGYDNSISFTFTATEGADESGISSVKLYQVDGSDETELKSWGAGSSYSYEITENGTYKIVATDNAGNVNSYEKNISNLSTVIPATPTITVDGTKGNGKWYINDNPKITITSQEQTSDGVNVVTSYYIIAGGRQLEKTATSGNFTFDLTERGEVTIRAVSVSYAGVSSEEAEITLYVDTVKPDLGITESTIDDKGNIVINFKSTDDVSGVNTSKVLVNGKPITVVDNDGVITGSFSASTANSFEIVTEDIAGNVSDTKNFVPMKLIVDPISDIDETSANITADVIQGTYDISECYIQYKKSTDSTYDTTCLANKYDESYGKRMEYSFRNLTSNTKYDYKVYASTKTSKEIKTYEGSFKTSSREATGVIYGSARYDSNFTDEMKNFPIYVTLYDGNTFIKTARINSDGDEYKFTDVSDGAYRIVATDGLLTKETAVTLEKGGIVYPTTYAADGGINFVLEGLSTEVVLEDNTVALTVDGLYKIYDVGYYNGNVSEADLAVVEAGGTIKITLYASYLDVSSVEDTTETIFEDRLGSTAVIERYINLEIIKEVRDADGNLVNGTPTNITRLAEPVTLSFPLGNLSGENIHVASLHGSGSDYSFKSWTNGTEAVLSNNYVTITTDRFSVYALYRYVVSDKTYTVKWLDGDGNIMKTETVKSGSAATPPTAIPTKTASAKYTYTFEGWDTDYSVITKDTIISAWFTANSIDDPTTEGPTSEGPTTEGPTTERPTTEGPTTEGPTTQEPDRPTTTQEPERPTTTQEPDRPTTTQEPERPTTTQEPERPTTTQEPGRPTTQEPDRPTTTQEPDRPTTTQEPNTPGRPTTTQEPNNPGNSSTTQAPNSNKSNTNNSISTEPVRYTYMGSASSPKTGDAAPIAVVVMIMISSSMGIVVLRKKAKKG